MARKENEFWGGGAQLSLQADSKGVASWVLQVCWVRDEWASIPKASGCLAEKTAHQRWETLEPKDTLYIKTMQLVNPVAGGAVFTGGVGSFSTTGTSSVSNVPAHQHTFTPNVLMTRVVVGNWEDLFNGLDLEKLRELHAS